MEKRKCIITLKMYVFEHHMYIYASISDEGRAIYVYIYSHMHAL